MARASDRRQAVPSRKQRLRIAIVTPAPRGSQAGNRISALRYARLFTALGYKARVIHAWDSAPTDLLVVLNAQRGARSVLRARAARPELPIVVVVTGTDVYGRHGSSVSMRQALEHADAIVGLQSHSVRILAQPLRRKSSTILQSYDGPILARRVADTGFEFLVLGHLRPEKDPFRAALATRLLPPDSAIHVVHAGKALSASMAQRAKRESANNPRYEWLGELPRARALVKLAAARALVTSSRIEGGPGVFSEALALGVPILASRIAALESILTPRHPGLFKLGSASELAALMRRIELEPRFEAQLTAWSRQLAPLVRPARESAAWSRLLWKWLAPPRARPTSSVPTARLSRRAR